MIHIICHKHDDMKQGTMELVKTYLVIYTMCKKEHEYVDNFMQLFKAQANTINSHRGRDGYHSKLNKNNLDVKYKS